MPVSFLQFSTAEFCKILKMHGDSVVGEVNAILVDESCDDDDDKEEADCSTMVQVELL